MKSFRLLPTNLTVCAVLAFASVSVNAAPPETPGSLRASVYSNTAIELFWDRPADVDGNLLEFEIKRNGVVVENRDGLSYFTEGLLPGTEYRWEVTAIDAASERSSAAIVFATTNGTGGDGPLIPMPSGFRFESYSATAGELFWERSAIPGLRYEVIRDEEIIGFSDGTSFFMDDLTYKFIYEYALIAIGPDGARSPSAMIFPGDEEIDPDIDTLSPLPPRNARFVKYSDTAGELLWERPAPYENIVATDVFKDGVLLGTTDGISFFDGNLIPTDTGRYELVAINADGERSVPNRVGEPDNSSDKVFAREDLDTFLPKFFEAVNGIPIEQVESVAYPYLLAANQEIDPASLGLQLLSFNDDNQTGEITSIHRCGTLDGEAAGSVTLYSDSDRVATAEFVDCLTTSGVLAHGEIGWLKSVNGIGVSVFQSGLTVVSGTLVFTSNAIARYNRLGDTTFLTRGMGGSFSSRKEDNSTYTEISSLDTRFYDFPIDDGFGTVWETFALLEADWTDGQVLEVSMVEKFTNRDGSSPYFTDGTLRIRSADRLSSLLIEADTGDSATFKVIINHNNGTSEAVRNWSNEEGLRCEQTLPSSFNPLPLTPEPSYGCF